VNVTVPVRVPAPGATGLTVAVNVTDWPNTELVADALTVVVVPAWLTVWPKPGEVLALKLESPLYTTVMVWPATESKEVAKVACPPESVFVLSAVAPSLKITVPVGVPDPGTVALTVAVNVTDWPKTDGFAEDVAAIVLLALLTTCVKVGEVLVLKLVSPLYATVMM
jgi:hypothetical protein